MRALLAMCLAVVVLLGVGLPVAYLVVSQDLPPMASRAEVEHTLKIFVEGQRQKALAGVDPTKIETYESLQRAQLSEWLIDGALAAEACPEYLALPKEAELDWTMRVVGFALGNGMGGPGPGRCELRFADRLANALGLPSDSHRAVAIYNLHRALSKEDLLLFELSSRYFDESVLGVKSASKRLFGKEPAKLGLAESAELLLAELGYKRILDCHDPNELSGMRNAVLDKMAAFNLVKKDAVERAKKERLHCLSRPG